MFGDMVAVILPTRFQDVTARGSLTARASTISPAGGKEKGKRKKDG
jgi:hypothetical protein